MSNYKEFKTTPIKDFDLSPKTITPTHNTTVTNIRLALEGDEGVFENAILMNQTTARRLANQLHKLLADLDEIKVRKTPETKDIKAGKRKTPLKLA